MQNVWFCKTREKREEEEVCVFYDAAKKLKSFKRKTTECINLPFIENIKPCIWSFYREKAVTSYLGTGPKERRKGSWNGWKKAHFLYISAFDPEKAVVT